MKLSFWFVLIAIGSLFLSGCATYPKYSDAASHFPPIQPGNGRLIIYSVDPSVQAIFKIKIDGETVGQIICPYALYFDRPAGNCLLAIHTGWIGPSASTILNLEDGQTQYIQIKETGVILAKYLLLPTDPDQASGQLAQCLYNKKFLKTSKQ